MNYRKSELLASESIATAGTKSIDISLTDPITSFTILVALTNNAAIATDHAAKAIKNIELVDGSKVLFSMTGEACQALDYYSRGVSGHNKSTFEDNGVNYSTYNINFGRFLFDPELAFLPDVYNNPQLKIDHNLALGGASPDAATMMVIANVFDGKAISPRGFLQATEHTELSLTDNNIDYVELPRDGAIRKIMLQCFSDLKSINNNIHSYKLGEEHDKRIIEETLISELLPMVASQYPRYFEIGEMLAALTAKQVFITPAYQEIVLAQQNADTNTTVYANPAVGQKKAIIGEIAGKVIYEASGFCPHGSFPILTGLQGDIEDWWDMTKVDNAQIKITAGASVDTGAKIKMIVEQLMSYAASA
jgi:hypothetical protein